MIVKKFPHKLFLRPQTSNGERDEICIFWIECLKITCIWKEKGFPLISISISSKYYPESFLLFIRENMIFLIPLCDWKSFISLLHPRMIIDEQWHWIFFHMQVISQNGDMKSIFHISLMSQYVNFSPFLMILGTRWFCKKIAAISFHHRWKDCRKGNRILCQWEGSKVQNRSWQLYKDHSRNHRIGNVILLFFNYNSQASTHNGPWFGSCEHFTTWERDVSRSPIDGHRVCVEAAEKWKWYLNLIPFHHLNHLVIQISSTFSFIFCCCWFVCCLPPSLLSRPRVRFESCLFVCVVEQQWKLNHPDSRESWDEWKMSHEWSKVECYTILCLFDFWINLILFYYSYIDHHYVKVERISDCVFLIRQVLSPETIKFP